jgi:hypothetical protein
LYEGSGQGLHQFSGEDDLIQSNLVTLAPTGACSSERASAIEDRPRNSADRGSEYCGKVEQHDYQLYLAVNDIDHTRTKAQSPQTNGICERFQKTILNDFYQVAFRKKIYATLEELQEDLDAWIVAYNHERTHQGKMCCGRTPNATFEDSKRICREKAIV